MGAAVAVVLIKERQIIEAFARAGATAPARARSLAEFPVAPGGVGLARLRERAVIREAAPGRWYADLEVWRAVRGTRRRMVIALLAIVLVLGGLALASGGLIGGAR